MSKLLMKALLPMMYAIACSTGSDSPANDDQTESDDTQGDNTDESTDSSEQHSEGEEFGTTSSSCPAVNRPSYETFGKDFMDTYCTRCHSSAVTGVARNGATPNYNFDTLADVIQHVDQIESVAASGPKATNTFMPPVSDGPSEDVRAQLGQWLACLASGVETAD